MSSSNEGETCFLAVELPLLSDLFPDAALFLFTLMVILAVLIAGLTLLKPSLFNYAFTGLYDDDDAEAVLAGSVENLLFIDGVDGCFLSEDWRVPNLLVAWREDFVLDDLFRVDEVYKLFL